MKNWKIRLAVLFMWISALSAGGCGREDHVLVMGATALPSQEESPGCAAGKETIIRVYVCGCVANPGVVSVPEGSRVEDALKAAGGFGADASRETVNLADWVEDGQMIYFPTREEAAFAIRNNICRCTGYVKIIDAILLAAELFRSGEVPQAVEEIRTAPVVHCRECDVAQMEKVVREFLGI